MPGIVAIVNAISTDVVAALAAAGYPALNTLQDGSAGKILLGRQRQFEQGSPNRIIFIPIGSDFTAKSPANPSPASTPNTYNAEALRQNQQRSIRSDNVAFEVRVWGVGANPDDSFDVTQAYYHQVIISVHKLTAGAYELAAGKWTDSSLQSSQMIVDGREFVFGIKFSTPVLGELLTYAPPAVVPDIVDTLTAQPGGVAEPGDC